MLAFFLYMVAFMDTVATIPTGAMAERWKWGSFVIWGLFCGALYYPLFAAWTWGGGWLSKTWDSFGFGAGYVDFAGSGVVHAVGGAAALAGALVLGPRIGKYGADGRPRVLAGHHIPMALLGTFILLFGWFGFNAASTFAASDVQFATVATNTAIAGGVRRHRRHALRQLADGQAGPRDDGQRHARRARRHHGSVRLRVAGDGGGHRRARRDHRRRRHRLRRAARSRRSGGCHLRARHLRHVRRAVRRFVRQRQLRRRRGTAPRSAGVKGLFWGDAGQFAAQLLGAVVIWTVIFGVAFAFFKIQNAISKAMGKGGIRSKEDHELAGLDLPEMGVLAYPEFVGSHEPVTLHVPEEKGALV